MAKLTPRERLAILHKAIRTINDAITKHVRPDPSMTADDFVAEVTGAVDNVDVRAAMKEPESPTGES